MGVGVWLMMIRAPWLERGCVESNAVCGFGRLEVDLQRSEN